MKKVLVVSFIVLASLILLFTFTDISGEASTAYSKYMLVNSYSTSIDLQNKIEIEKAKLEEAIVKSGLIVFTFPFDAGDRAVKDGDIFNTWGNNNWRAKTTEIKNPDGTIKYVRKAGKHGGTDLSIEGNPDDVVVVSMVDGLVKRVGYSNGGGGYVAVIVDNVYGLNITYMHLKENSFFVKVGDHVRVGDPVAIMGNTGSSTATHLHVSITYPGTDQAFETITEGNIVNGLDMFDPRYFAYTKESFPKNFIKNPERTTEINLE